MPRKSHRRVVAARTIAGLAVAATACSLAYAAPALAMPKPTPPAEIVTQHQVDQAQATEQAQAAQVGRLAGEIAQEKIQIQQAEARAELAEQKYAYAYTQWIAAQDAARRAQQLLTQARQQVQAAHAKFIKYIQASYMSGDLGGTAGTLLTARDPSALLEHSTLEQYQQQHKADAVGAYQVAAVTMSNREAAAQRAVIAAAKAKVRAEQQKEAAHAAFVAEQQQKAALEHDMAIKQAQLQAAQDDLASKRYGHAQWVDYQNKLSKYNAWKAEQERRQRQLELERERQLHQSGGGGGGGSAGGSGFTPGPAPPSGGSWTPAKGERAAQRAKSQLGTPYAWAGGGAYGPSRGVCDPSNGAPNDCYVIGYDCSGLAMYAWGAGWWAHYAATQYVQAGRYHPSAANLRPGDLIFWSFNGAISGIHHVAIYIGGGQIVEAPYSGGYVQIASLWEYGGFFGATRPFT